MLPQEFLERMEEMLGGEFPAFFKSYETDRHRALRVSLRKTDRESFLRRAPFSLSPVPWAENGFYYGREDLPGKHPYHAAGVYYIQEPSAMAPAEYLMQGLPAGETDRARERVLDLCAAPGGKSTQIAEKMRGRGILVCNEIHPARAKILSENIERMGIANALVLNETPQKLAEYFPDYFTRVLVDAPCSGEGMFRKNEEACGEWSPAGVDRCAARQDEILDCAASMLCPGGKMVYSTCTFAPAENEGSIGRFLARHPEFSVVEAERADGMSAGVPEWGAGMTEGLEKTIRLWPHRLAGEGHFIAVLKKEDDGTGTGCPCGLECGIPERELKMPQKGILEWNAFAAETIQTRNVLPGNGRFLRFGEQLYRIPEGMPQLRGLKVVRPGLHLGTIRKNRFEPSHALALALAPDMVTFAVDFDLSDGDAEKTVRRYLGGETFPCSGDKGWHLIAVDGYSVGWGRLAGGTMKNFYPKGLRRM